MSLSEWAVDRLEEMQQEMLRERYPYLTAEASGFSRKWVLRQRGSGCRPVKLPAAISMAKNPPPLPGAPPKPAAPAAPPTAMPAPQGKPDAAASKNASAPKKKEEDCPQPPLFDMLDIPEGMDAMGYTYAAKCARRWFHGPDHVIPDGSNIPVDKAFVDDTGCKLSWVRKFGKVQARYEHLLSRSLKPTDKENIYNDAARNDLRKKFQSFLAKPNQYYSGTSDALAVCGNDIQLLHQRFQFQRTEVSMTDVLGSHTTVMNDLAASLANFNFYAAVANANILNVRYNRYDTNPWQHCAQATVEITHVYVYIKDVYSFNDPHGRSVSQYLGHWNRSGVIIGVDAAAAELISKWSTFFEHERNTTPRWYLPSLPHHLDNAVDTGTRLRKAEVFYPVRNRDFRHWRNLKGRGGDFVIYSDLERIRLPKPIVLDLEEVCEAFKR